MAYCGGCGSRNAPQDDNISRWCEKCRPFMDKACEECKNFAYYSSEHRSLTLLKTEPSKYTTRNEGLRFYICNICKTEWVCGYQYDAGTGSDDHWWLKYLMDLPA